jgi:8-oxo-dGTP pyrophosphatase MutT (NUDIX family)
MGVDVPVRRASTVVLARDGDRGVEVFTLHRAAALVFAPGVVAFPGGGVDPTDRAELAVPGRPLSWWATRLDLPEPEAAELLAAAVRELFEETGVLLGAAPAVEPGPAADRERLRLELTAHRVGVADVLAAEGIAAPFDQLVPWARWITPPGQTRRYDTYFFVAVVPGGQQPAMVTSEAEHGQWDRPADLIAAHAAGERRIMPPTLSVLHQVGDAATVAELLATERTIKAVRPRVISAPGEPLRVEVEGREMQVEPR